MAYKDKSLNICQIGVLGLKKIKCRSHLPTPKKKKTNALGAQ